MSNSTASELEALQGLGSAKRLVFELATRKSEAHAILLYGVEGAGKKQLAQILTKAWLCQSPLPEGACGSCQACRAFERGRSADLLLVQPVGASRIIRLDALMETTPDPKDYPTKLLDFVRTSPLAARMKVVVIEEAERMNSRTANALLKTLEEPHSFAKFILITSAVGSLLPTILSRCVAVACELPSRDQISGEAWAVEMAGGAPHKTAYFSEAEAAYRPIYDFGRTFHTRPQREALTVAEEFGTLTDSLQNFKKIGARAANAEGLELLAVIYSTQSSHSPESLQAIAEAHRRILGNASASSTFDALFSAILK